MEQLYRCYGVISHHLTTLLGGEEPDVLAVICNCGKCLIYLICLCTIKEISRHAGGIVGCRSNGDRSAIRAQWTSDETELGRRKVNEAKKRVAAREVYGCNLVVDLICAEIRKRLGRNSGGSGNRRYPNLLNQKVPVSNCDRPGRNGW